MFKDEEQGGEDDKSRQGYDKGPAEETMVTAFGVFKIRIEAHCRGRSTHLGKAREKNRGIAKHACEAYLLSAQVFCHNKKGSDKTNGNANIVYYCTF